MVNVTKHYRGGGGIEAVDLDVQPGEVFAFLGPNGAGKTTTIRLILDLIRPDHGTISVFGLDSRRESVEVRELVGYLPGELGLYERLTARELLTHFAYLRHGLPWARIAEIAARLDLEVDRPIGSLSKGNRQKVGLVQAFMGSPSLLILDEPTSGLDPLVQHEVLEMMKDSARAGGSVFLSSHILSEVANVADRVGMIRDGRVISIERVDDLQSKSVHYVYVSLADGTDAASFSLLPGVSVRSRSDHGFELEVRGHLDDVIRLLAQHPLAELTIRAPSLEEFFLSTFGIETAPRSGEEEDAAAHSAAG